MKRNGETHHPPLDPADIDDPVARAVAARFVAGEIEKRENRGRRRIWSSDAYRKRTHGSGVHRRGRLRH